ncbi:MAG TPA: hypothetical protein VND65_15120 [Candidatus Binatia bacterium]|nr:hypothetical protein [Candidatus Binatia bacterium]
MSTFWAKSLSVIFVSAMITAAAWPGVAQEANRQGESATSDLYVKVQLDHPLKTKKLKPGDVIEGQLARDVYSSDRELFRAGSRVDLTVDHLEKRRRPRDDHWPWVIKAFTPRHENYPVFKTATVAGTDGQSRLQVSVISISRKREVYAQGKKKKGQAKNEPDTVEVSRSGGVYGPGKLAAPMMILEASIATPGTDEAVPSAPDYSALETLPAGTACKILLLNDVSASKSKPGDAVRARLLEPVVVNSRVALPAGSLIEGRVVKKTPPRWGSRAGSLALTFTDVTLPGGNRIPMAASLTGAELDRASHTKIDAEGELHGEHPGKAWMAINIGVTAGLAKEVDDGTQLIIEAIVSTATDASTAGTSRIVSSCISGIFMVSRHGRDVILPRFTEMNIALDRPLAVTHTPESAAVLGGSK